jgi:hypothetical protein
MFDVDVDVDVPGKCCCSLPSVERAHVDTLRVREMDFVILLHLDTNAKAVAYLLV